MTTFYTVSAGAAATLVGLLYVAVQIGPPLVQSGPIGRRHAMARSTFTIFAVVFALSMFFLVPGPPRSRALSVIAAALLGGFRAVRTWIPVWRDRLQGRIEFRIWQTAWLLIGPLLTYAYLAIGGLAQLGSSDPGRLDPYAGGAFIILFVIGMRNTWNLLVEADATPGP